jgi:predicted SAM-dependent methyltransferase
LVSDRKKLELGCGERPTPGYFCNDINAFPGVDIVGNPWEIGLEDNSLDEAIALGLMEHLLYADFDKTLVNVYRMLKPGGVFLFDVPDIPIWCGYVVDHFAGKPTPFTIDHCFSTLYGWQRWPGDDHSSGWYKEKVEGAVRRGGFSKIEYDLQAFLSRGLERRRMTRPADAHLYCVVTK